MAEQITATADEEFEAMRAVYAALSSLDEAARDRVLKYVSSRLGVSVDPRASGPVDEAVLESQERESAAFEVAGSKSFDSFAELFDAAQPKTQPEKVLVSAYWVQVCRAADTFDGFSVNKELKNLGEGVVNVTSALDALRAQKPALVLQLKKSGKTRQARKTYKLTVAGIKSVEAMTHG